VVAVGCKTTINFSASDTGPGSAILQLCEGSLDFDETETTKTFQVKNVGSDGTILSWNIEPFNAPWLTFTPMSGTTASGSGTLVTAVVDRTQITGPVSTAITVNGANNSVNLNVSVAYVDNTLVVADGLFCFFNFDGEEITDYYGNYTGINNGAVASTDTPSGAGKSMQFDGNVSIMVQDNIIPTGNSFSVNIWFKTTRIGQYLIGSNVEYNGKAYYCMGLDENSSFVYHANGVSDLNGWTTNPMTSCTNNQWHMLTITYENKVVMCYLDGVMVDSKTHNNLKWSNDVQISFIGDAATNNELSKFNGKLDNFRSYNRALTAQEVQMLFNAKQ